MNLRSCTRAASQWLQETHQAGRWHNGKSLFPSHRCHLVYAHHYQHNPSRHQHHDSPLQANQLYSLHHLHRNPIRHPKHQLRERGCGYRRLAHHRHRHRRTQHWYHSTTTRTPFCRHRQQFHRPTPMKCPPGHQKIRYLQLTLPQSVLLAPSFLRAHPRRSMWFHPQWRRCLHH